MHDQCEPNRWKGFVHGMTGSIAGLIAMRMYWQHIAPIVSNGSSNGQEQESQADEPQPLDDISLTGPYYRPDESSTAVLGRMLYQQIAGQEPQSKEAKTMLSYLVHWGYGMLNGGLYGASRSSAAGLDLPGGAAFATSLWLFGDELAVPLLGLQSGPTAASPTQHANRLGAHLAYGLATAAATGLLRRFF